MFNKLPQFLQEIVNTDSLKMNFMLIQKEYYTVKDFLEDHF